MKKKIEIILRIFKEGGVKGVFHFSINYFRKKKEDNSIGFYEHFEFLKYTPFGDENNQGEGKTINWVVPDFHTGSGGHLNIFRLISLLEKKGFRCEVVIAGPSHFLNGDNARDVIRKHYAPVEAKVVIGEKNMSPASFTVATSWQTAYAVRNFQSTFQKCYFVQDYEPFFYARGSEYLFAEQTYRFGFHGITAGNWLADMLNTDFGMETTPIGFGVDTHLYRPFKTQRKNNAKRVFFYARPPTPRRGYELGLLVLAKVFAAYSNVEFVLAGWDGLQLPLWLPHKNIGLASLNDLPEIYSSCDLALVLSFTNLSLLPLELMASGCPVVSNDGPNVEWLLDDSVAVLASSTIESLSAAIVDLLDNDDKRVQLRQAGLDFVKNKTWEAEAEKVSSLLNTLLS